MTKLERLEHEVLGFFAAPSNGATAGAFRICFGLLACWESVGVWLNLHRYWADDGLVPFSNVQSNAYVWLSPLSWAPGSEAMLLAHGALMSLASIALLVGFAPRAAALLLAFVHMSLQFRNPFILNSGDRLFMILAALSALAPLAHRYSVDAWWRKRRGLDPRPPATVWGLRLLQLQIAYVYANSFIAKVANERWQTGMALRDVLASPVFAEVPVYVDSKPLLWALTYGTLVFEIVFPVAIWWKRYRPWLIATGIAFHVGIDLTMVIPIFSAAMIISYVSFLDDDETEALIARIFRKRAAPAVDSAKAAESAHAG